MPKKNDVTQEPFVRYNLKNKKNDTFTVWLNKGERTVLDDGKRILLQPKDSTALKHLAEIGSAYLRGEASPTMVLEIVLKNKSNNERGGIEIVE